MNQLKIMWFSHFLNYKKLSIAVNLLNGKWIKYPKQCNDILKKAINLGLTENQLYNALVDNEDRAYMKKLIIILKEYEIISTDSDLELLKIDDITLMISHRCNLKCRHCSACAASVEAKEYFEFDEICEIIDKIKECNPKTIVLTGGEPLIRSDFIDILRYTRKDYSGNIVLMSNGTLLTPENVEEISNLITTIDISIDGVDEKSCSLIRGAGVFNQVIECISLLQKYNFNKISLSMVGTPQNLIFKEQFFELGEKLNIHVYMRNFEIIGRASQNVDELNFIYSDNPLYPQKETDVFSGKPCICLAGKTSLTIRANGDIYPCQMFVDKRYKLCNITEILSLKLFLLHVKCENNDGYHNFRRYHPIDSDVCGSCPVNIFCWDCPYSLFKASNEGSSECLNDKKKVMLMKSVWGDDYAYSNMDNKSV